MRRRDFQQAVKGLSFNSSSHFLDIGSGLGKCVLHLVMATGCRGTGIEVLEHRVNVASQFLDTLVRAKVVPA